MLTKVPASAFLQQQPSHVDVALLATISVVTPFSIARLTSAPLSSNNRAASRWPAAQARCSGVVPFIFARLTSAFFCSSSRAASTWPFAGKPRSKQQLFWVGQLPTERRLQGRPGW